MDALHIAASGIRSAELRLAASAHNVANFATPAFRPLRATQSPVEGGGSTVRLDRAPNAEEVDLMGEIFEQLRASIQFGASLRTYAVASETRGSLIDLLA